MPYLGDPDQLLIELTGSIMKAPKGVNICLKDVMSTHYLWNKAVMKVTSEKEVLIRGLSCEAMH